MYRDKIIHQKYYQCYNLFDAKIVEELSDSCDTHFIHNLNKHSFDRYQLTNCIMDCHGLHLTDSLTYPYSQQCWNIFCKTICQKVKKYITILHPELLKPKWKYTDIFSTGYQIFPHSCWAIKVLSDKEPKERCYLEKSRDLVFNKDTFVTAIYYLQNSSIGNGTVVQFDNTRYYKSDGVENSLFIFRDSKFGEYIPYKNKESKTVIRFEFCVLGENHYVPWTAPRVVGP